MLRPKGDDLYCFVCEKAYIVEKDNAGEYQVQLLINEV